MARVIRLTISDGQARAVVSEFIPMSLVQGAAFRVTNRPVPLPLISMLFECSSVSFSSSPAALLALGL